MMAVGINLFIVAWVHLTASLTRMEKEWNDILARCLWADYLLTSMKVYLQRTINCTVHIVGNSYIVVAVIKITILSASKYSVLIALVSCPLSIMACKISLQRKGHRTLGAS